LNPPALTFKISRVLKQKSKPKFKMKNTFLKIAVCALLAAPALSRGQNTPMSVVTAPPAAPAPAVVVPEAEPATNATAKPKKPRTTMALSGKASNVDTNAMTLTVGKHTFDITSDTHITKDGKPAVLSEIAVDEKVGVSYKKNGEKFDAITINVIATKKSEKSAAKAEKAADKASTPK